MCLCSSCRRRSHSIPDPESPAAPPPLKPLLSSSCLTHVEALHTPRNPEMEAQTSQSPPSAQHLPQSSSLLLSPCLRTALRHRHLPCLLNPQTPAVPEPWLCFSDAAGRERATVTRSRRSSLESRCCWTAASHSAAWPGSSEPGAERSAGSPVEQMRVWHLEDLRVVSDPGGGG